MYIYGAIYCYTIINLTSNEPAGVRIYSLHRTPVKYIHVHIHTVKLYITLEKFRMI